MDKLDMLQQLRQVYPALGRSFDNVGNATNHGDPVAQLVVDVVGETWQPVADDEQFAAVSFELKSLCDSLSLLYQQAERLSRREATLETPIGTGCLLDKPYLHYQLECLTCPHFVANYEVENVQQCGVTL